MDDEKILLKTQLYSCMVLIDEILNKSIIKGEGTCDSTLTQDIENARCKFASLKIRLHRWEAVIGEIESPEPNPIDEIARQNGWTPLVVDENMGVSFNNQEYTITRTKDEW